MFQTPAQSQGVDLLLGLGSSQPAAAPAPVAAQNPPDLWGDFASAGQWVEV